MTVVGALGCGSPAPPRNVTPPGASVDADRIALLNQRIAANASSDLPPPGARDDTYRIGPNDQLDVVVFGAESFSGSHRVGASGEIAIPLVGAVEAGGLTPRELEERLEQKLRETYMRDPHVSVQVLEMRSAGVSVVGAVQAPGVYQVSGSARVLEVLAMAGGLTPEAGSSVYVMRASRGEGVQPAAQPEIIEVDLGALLEGGDASQNVAVFAGDVVQVRPAGLVYVVGAVNQPGGFTIPPGRPMTVLQAVAMAENVTNRAKASESVIVREHRDGTREEIPVNLDEVLNGEQVPPVLDPGDVLFVPTNGAKNFALGAVDALVRMVTFRGIF